MQIRPATEQDLKELLHWFPTEREAKQWGGPAIHFPLNLERLRFYLHD